MWDSSARIKIHDIELVQNSAICFVRNLKGHTDSVFVAKNQLQLKSLEDIRRKNHHQLCFFTRILQNEVQHHTLCTFFRQTVGDSRHSCSCQEESQSQYYPRKAASTQVSCHELFVRSVEKTSNNCKTAKCCNSFKPLHKNCQN